MLQNPDIIVVGGLNPCNTRWSPSDGCTSDPNYGASFGTNLDVVAPATRVYATTLGGGYDHFFGTSNSSPNVAGVCALILSALPNLTRKDVEAYICLSAERVGPYTYDSIKTYGNWNQEMGYGRVNARLALQLALSGVDKTSPVIYHDRLLYSSTDSTTRVAIAFIKDNRRLSTGSNAPRLYYRVGTGSFNPVNAFLIVADTFKFNIPGQSPNSTVEYYFAAQDTVSPANMSTLPLGGSGINPPGTTPPQTRFNYTVGKIKIGISTTTPKICPNQSTIYDTIVIAPFDTSLQKTIIDVDVTVNVSHWNDADVDLYLIRGSSQSELSTDNGGSGDSYVETTFDDEAAISITSGSAPFTGRFRPETPLTVFDGQPVEGTWILRMTDDEGNYLSTGTLDSWTITITYTEPLGIENISSTIPAQFALYQNYPNPFNPVTKIRFALPKSSFAKLVVYDILGREVTTLVNEELKPGSYEVVWNASNYPSGVYFYSLVTEGFSETKKMILLK